MKRTLTMEAWYFQALGFSRVALVACVSILSMICSPSTAIAVEAEASATPLPSDIQSGEYASSSGETFALTYSEHTSTWLGKVSQPNGGDYILEMKKEGDDLVPLRASFRSSYRGKPLHVVLSGDKISGSVGEGNSSLAFQYGAKDGSYRSEKGDEWTDEWVDVEDAELRLLSREYGVAWRNMRDRRIQKMDDGLMIAPVAGQTAEASSLSLKTIYEEPPAWAAEAETSMKEAGRELN